MQPAICSSGFRKEMLVDIQKVPHDKSDATSALQKKTVTSYVDLAFPTQHAFPACSSRI